MRTIKTVMVLVSVFLIASYVLPGKSFEIIREPVVIMGEITAYNAVAAQTDDTPDIVASGKKAQVGMVACPSYLEFGTKVEIGGKLWTCEDRMARRFRDGHYFDLLVDSHREALKFGRQQLAVIIYQ